MILKDFEKKGFPICAKSPVLCIGEDFQVFAVYNRFDLNSVLQKYKIKLCYGVWPGRQNTDCFILDPDAYVKLPLPPERHRNIDNARDIQVIFTDSVFDKVSYIPPDDDPEYPGNVRVESKEEEVYQYLKKAGVRFKTLFS